MELIKLKQSTDKLKEEHWKAIIQECNRATRDGEVTKTEWLKTNNICQATFYNWQKQFRNHIATDLLIESAQSIVQSEMTVTKPVNEVEFVELKKAIPPSEVINIGAVLKINHAIIELNDDISEELLSKIFKVISHVE